MESSKTDRQSRRVQLDALWKAAEVKHGVTASPEERAFLEEYMGLSNPEDYVSQADIESVLDEFIEHGPQALRRYLARAAEPGRAAGRRRGHLATEQSPRRRVYGSAQAKRLLVLRFVSQRVIPVANRGERSFDTAGHAISWKQIHAEWKRERPGYRGSVAALERAYRRARSDRDLCELYFDQEFRDWAALVENVRPALSFLAAAGLQPQDVFVKTIPGPGPRIVGVEGSGPASPAEQVLMKAKYWNAFTAKAPAPTEATLMGAVQRKCGLTVDSGGYLVDWDQGTKLCEGPDCHRCWVGRNLAALGIVPQEALTGRAAVGASARLDERFQNHAHNMRVLQRAIAAGRQINVTFRLPVLGSTRRE